MEPKELMFDDWVSYEQFIKNDSQYVFSKVDLTLLEHAYIGITKVVPIPLTEEILEANGFENYELHRWSLKTQWQWNITIYLYETDSVISIDKEIEGRKGVDSCHICYKGYVHELQHALRLCGLNELADNFKIK